jgi:hypothetical protein
MPKPRNVYQSTNPPFNGLSAPFDPTYNAGNSRFFFRIQTKTADYTILESDFGTIFTNFGTTADVAFTLPAVTNLPDGWWVIVFCADLADFVSVASSGSSDNLVTINDISADSVKLDTNNERAGGGWWFVWDDTNSKWLVFTMTGETQTVTIA